MTDLCGHLLNLAIFQKFAKLKTLPKFPAIVIYGASSSLLMVINSHLILCCVCPQGSAETNTSKDSQSEKMIKVKQIYDFAGEEVE